MAKKLVCLFELSPDGLEEVKEWEKRRPNGRLFLRLYKNSVLIGQSPSAMRSSDLMEWGEKFAQKYGLDLDRISGGFFGYRDVTFDVTVSKKFVCDRGVRVSYSSVADVGRGSNGPCRIRTIERFYVGGNSYVERQHITYAGGNPTNIRSWDSYESQSSL